MNSLYCFSILLALSIVAESCWSWNEKTS